MSIDITNYPVLNTYAALAYSGITTVNNTTITNGLYGSSPTASYVGPIVGTVDSANAGTAQVQLTALVLAINAFITPLPSQTLGTIIAPITLYPNINYNSTSTIIFQGIPIILDGQGDSDAQFFITASSAFTFNNIPSITLINGARNCNVFWLAGSAVGFTGTAPPIIPGVFIAGSAVTFANASTISGRLYAQTENVAFNGTSGTSSLDSTCDSSPIICYAKGTLISTTNGFVPIENIEVGHHVITKGRIFKNKFIKKNSQLQIKPVHWISKFTVSNMNKKSRPICIKKDALAKNYPFTDLYVSPNHGFLINNKMVIAKKMVNGTTIYQDNECDQVEYYHLECDHHTAIFANGVLSESYLDLNNRHVFENSIPPKRKLNIKKKIILKRKTSSK